MEIIRSSLKVIFYEFIKIVALIILPYAKIRKIINPSRKIHVLVYHSICQSYGKGGADELSVPRKSFEEQIKYLARKNYTVICIEDALKCLYAGNTLPSKAVCITFDDGYLDNYTYAFPILKQYGFKASFYLVTDYLASQKPFAWRIGLNVPLSLPLDWTSIREMEDQGMEFGSHSHTHPDFSKISDTDMAQELSESKDILQRDIAQLDIIFSCPFGIHNKRRKDIIILLRQYGYAGAFLGKWGSLSVKTSPFDMPRISIYGKDSLTVFKCKIEGAFDWLAPIYSLWQLFWEKAELILPARKEQI